MKKNKIIVLIVTLLTILITAYMTLLDELELNIPIYLLIEELIIMLLSIFLIIFLFYEVWQKEKELRAVNLNLKESLHTLKQKDVQLLKARREYGDYIRKQFEDWQFTKSEKDVAYLLLKGLSLKEISVFRNIKEKSARQQASNLYNKANLPGRHALSAWFFEDMF